MKNRAFLLQSAILLVSFMISQNLYAQQDKVSESKVNALISKKISMDKDGEFKDRYTIQIYYGEYHGAQRMKEQYAEKGLIYKLEQRYEEPNHKIWIGNYRSKLEAEQALIVIKKEFPNAFVLKP